MIESPKIITRVRRGETITRQFSFTETMIPTSPTPALQAQRVKSWQAFQSLPMPSLKDEAWRRTDISTMKSDLFQLPDPESYLDLDPVPADLLQPIADELHGGQVVVTPGGAQIQLDPDLAAEGVIFCDFKTALLNHPRLIERLSGQIVPADESKFTALAYALGVNGIFLYVPAGIQVEQPLHGLSWGPGANLAHLDHVLVWVEEGASVTFVHEAASPAGHDFESLHCGVVEIYVGQAARLNFVELQSWAENVWNFTHERARVDIDGQLDWVFGAVGSRLTKNFSDLDLVGRGATGRMSGFYFTDHNQHLDHDTEQNHLAPNTTSDLLFKGALIDESRSVWQGNIYVAPGAVKTDGYQANRNLVLSRKARADSIPGLEILADDVRCTHGATVGKIDETQMFYLLSRGIPRPDAERLIVEGFFDPVMQRIPFEGVRQRFQQAILHKMDKNSP